MQRAYTVNKHKRRMWLYDKAHPEPQMINWHHSYLYRRFSGNGADAPPEGLMLMRFVRTCVAIPLSLALAISVLSQVAIPGKWLGGKPLQGKQFVTHIADAAQPGESSNHGPRKVLTSGSDRAKMGCWLFLYCCRVSHRKHRSDLAIRFVQPKLLGRHATSTPNCAYKGA